MKTITKSEYFRLSQAAVLQGAVIYSDCIMFNNVVIARKIKTNNKTVHQYLVK
jgi:hypothetical protein